MILWSMWNDSNVADRVYIKWGCLVCVCLCVIHTVFTLLRVWQNPFFPNTPQCDPDVSTKPSSRSDCTIPFSFLPFIHPPTTPPTLPFSHAGSHWCHHSGIPQPANPHPFHPTPLLGLGWLTSMLDRKHRRCVQVICGAGAGIRTCCTVV